MRFHFLGAEEDSDLYGTVLLREGDMVLDIDDGDGPYCIVGKLREHRYEGTSDVRGMIKSVWARWADVGGMYVGVWIEDGYEYLFSFETRRDGA